MLVAQADALGMRDRLSAWFAASAVARGLDAGAGVAGGANGGARGARWRETGAQFSRVSPSKRDDDYGRVDDAWRQRERSNVRLDRGRAGHLGNEAANNATRNVATDVSRDAAGGGYARSHEPPTSRAPAPVPRGDDQLLMRMEAQLAEQDRALRALSEQLARFEAAARAEAMSRHADGLAGGLAHGGATGRTQRGYRASSSRWRQRRSSGVGSDFGRRPGRSAGAARSDGSRDRFGDCGLARSGGDGSGGGSGRGSNGGDGRRAADGAGHGASRESGGGRGFGAGEGRGSGGGVGSGSGMGAGHGSGTGSGKASGGRKSRGRTASAHGPRDRYSRMRQLRQRLSSRRNSRSSPEHEHEHDFERGARLPRERGPRHPREGRETSVSSHGASHEASHASSRMGPRGHAPPGPSERHVRRRRAPLPSLMSPAMRQPTIMTARRAKRGSTWRSTTMWWQPPPSARARPGGSFPTAS